jgi:hypothetical protein
MCAPLAEPKRPPDNEPVGLFSSHLAQAAKHFAADEAEPQDSAERWGKRFGRALSLVAFVVLAWYFGHQLNWW